MRQKTILVVCNGNIHRSVIAEYCLNRELKKKALNDRFIVISRGLQGTLGTKIPSGKNLCDYPSEWALSDPVLLEFNIDISKHCTTPIDVSVIERASLILAMDYSVLMTRINSLIQQFPKHAYKMRLFRELEGNPIDVPDCFGSSDVALHRYVIELINEISKKHIDVFLKYIQLFTLKDNKGDGNVTDTKVVNKLCP